MSALEPRFQTFSWCYNFKGHVLWFMLLIFMACFLAKNCEVKNANILGMNSLYTFVLMPIIFMATFKILS